MPAPATTNLISYEIYGFQQAWLKVSDGAGTPAIVEVPIHKPNKVGFEADQETITFDGGNTLDKIFLMTGLNLTFDADCLPIGALAGLFNSPLVTTGLTGYSRRFYGGNSAANTGITAGFRGRAAATKFVDGAQVGTVVVDVEVFAGTLTQTSGPTLASKGKSDPTQFRLAATQTTKDVIGGALPGVPTGGSFYSISEVA